MEDFDIARWSADEIIEDTIEKSLGSKELRINFHPEVDIEGCLDITLYVQQGYMMEKEGKSVQCINTIYAGSIFNLSDYLVRKIINLYVDVYIKSKEYFLKAFNDMIQKGHSDNNHMMIDHAIKCKETFKGLSTAIENMIVDPAIKLLITVNDN